MIIEPAPMAMSENESVRTPDKEKAMSAPKPTEAPIRRMSRRFLKYKISNSKMTTSAMDTEIILSFFICDALVRAI